MSQAGNPGVDASTGAGGANSGGVTSQGGSSGASTGGAGGRGTGGTAGTGNGGASGGAVNGGAGGGSGRACPGYEDGDAARFCRARSDCPPQPQREGYCVNALPRTSACPIPNLPPVDECGPTKPCPTDWACQSLPQCNVRFCALTAPCTEANCNGGRRCSNGTCVPIPCDQPGGQKCPARWECVPNAPAGQPWCKPAVCASDGDCPPPSKCGGDYPDAHGCGGVLCERDDQCACGYCVNRLCAPQLGLCDYRILAMPYGCVWPDEELV